MDLCLSWTHWFVRQTNPWVLFPIYPCVVLLCGFVSILAQQVPQNDKNLDNPDRFLSLQCQLLYSNDQWQDINPNGIQDKDFVLDKKMPGLSVWILWFQWKYYPTNIILHLICLRSVIKLLLINLASKVKRKYRLRQRANTIFVKRKYRSLSSRKYYFPWNKLIFNRDINNTGGEKKRPA